MASEANIYVMNPSYDGMCRQELIGAMLFASKNHLARTYTSQGFSGPSHNFNLLFSRALNARKTGTTHALMLHSDVVPLEHFWLDTLYDEMVKHEADIISVVQPIKNNQGLTSIAIDDRDFWKPRRLTMREIMNRPTTFTLDRLLINTGLLLLDIRKPWAEQIWFEYNDKIEKVGDEFVARFESEDWSFSRKARALGAKIFATRVVKCHHYGNGVFNNYSAWGSLETDTANA